MRLKLRTPNVVYLRITAFDRVAWSSHCYGVLDCGGKEVSVKYLLSQEEADRLNKTDGVPTHKAGESSARFFSKDQLGMAALEAWRTHFPVAKYLIEGESNVHEPQWIIEGPESIRTRVNAIFAEYGRFTDWETEARLLTEWELIWKKEIQ